MQRHKFHITKTQRHKFHITKTQSHQFHITQLTYGQEAGFVQIDSSSAFDRVYHQGNLYKLCSLGLRFSVLFILTVSIKSIIALYAGWLSEYTRQRFFGRAAGCVLGPVFFLLFTSLLFSTL